MPRILFLKSPVGEHGWRQRSTFNLHRSGETFCQARFAHTCLGLDSIPKVCGAIVGFVLVDDFKQLTHAGVRFDN